MAKRRLFCELGPWAYALSTQKEIALRRGKDLFSGAHFSREKGEALPQLIYEHKSLIRRQLGNVDMALQENKAVNLALAAPHVNGILIRPGETFSFWKLVGNPSARKGYRPGLTIVGDHPEQGIGGGLCQFTNLLHWMVLHSPLTLVERHHHNGVDLFPDFGRQLPFGTGTSILYNYLDYRVRNDTENTYQFLVWTDDKYLWGQLRAQKPQPLRYHISSEEEYFSREGKEVYRNGKVYRSIIDPRSGNCLERQLLQVNHARVLYDTTNLVIREPEEK